MGKNLTVFFTGLVLAAGFAAAGGAVCYGLIAGKQANRTVSVRGLAEREVDADLAVWPLKFTVAADDLTSLNEAVKRDSAIVEAYLAKNNVGLILSSSRSMSTMKRRECMPILRRVRTVTSER